MKPCPQKARQACVPHCGQHLQGMRTGPGVTARHPAAQDVKQNHSAQTRKMSHPQEDGQRPDASPGMTRYLQWAS